MKKPDLGQTISVLAKLGVIAGIAFLATELKQNNELLRAEAEYNYLQNRLCNRERIAEDARRYRVALSPFERQTHAA